MTKHRLGFETAKGEKKQPRKTSKTKQKPTFPSRSAASGGVGVRDVTRLRRLRQTLLILTPALRADPNIPQPLEFPGGNRDGKGLDGFGKGWERGKNLRSPAINIPNLRETRGEKPAQSGFWGHLLPLAPWEGSGKSHPTLGPGKSSFIHRDRGRKTLGFWFFFPRFETFSAARQRMEVTRSATQAWLAALAAHPGRKPGGTGGTQPDRKSVV